MRLSADATRLFHSSYNDKGTEKKENTKKGDTHTHKSKQIIIQA